MPTDADLEREVREMLGLAEPSQEDLERDVRQMLGLSLQTPRSTSKSLEVNQRWKNQHDFYRYRGDGGPKWTDVRHQYGFEVIRKGRSKLDQFIVDTHYQTSVGPKGVTLPVAMYRKAGPAAKTELVGAAYFNFPPATSFLNQLKPSWWVSPRTGKPGGDGSTRYFGPWETGGYETEKAYVEKLIRQGYGPHPRRLVRPSQAEAKARRQGRYEVGPQGRIKRTDHLKFGEVLELTRFVLIDAIPYGGETPFLRECFKFLRQLTIHTGFMKANNLPPVKVRCILSHSDPIPIKLKSGRITLPGHIGNIYQAHNAFYVGRSTVGMRHHLPDGSGYDGQNLSKVARGPGTQGFDYSYHALLTNIEGEPTGISAKRRGESWKDYASRIRSTELENRRHPGNLVYAWAIGSSKQKKQIEKGFAKAVDAEGKKLYLKRPRQKYLNLEGRYNRAVSRGNFGKAKTIAEEMERIFTTKLNSVSRESVTPPPLPQQVQRDVRRRRRGAAAIEPRFGYTLSQLYSQAGLLPEPE